jgi:hypothetical protein
MGSQWPKATAARAGLAQLAGPTSQPLVVHSAHGMARVRLGRAWRMELTSGPTMMRFIVYPTPQLKLHAATATPQWEQLK